MSSQNMGRASKDRGNKTQNTPHKNATEWPKAPDGMNPKVQATAEQIRIAQIINEANKSDDPDLQKKIDQVSELTGKSNDTAIIALHDCDNDPERAVIMLLEGTQNEGEWELSGKKKKNRQSQKQMEAASEGGKGSTSAQNNKENRTEKGERNRGDRGGERNRGGDRGGDRGDRGGDGKSGRDDFRNRGPPRLNRGRGGGGGNWRNKENEKNERNLEESRRERNADGKDEGRPRGGRRGRGNRGGDGNRGNREGGGGGGGGGGRVRTFQNRGLSSDGFPQSMDTWTNSTAEQASDNAGRSKGANHGGAPPATGNWSEIANSEDWSEEDWTESLTETKVFTPSTSVQSGIQKNEEPSPSQLSQSLDLVSLLAKQQTPSSSDLSSVNKNSMQSNGVSPMSGGPQVGSSASQLGQNQFSLSPYAQQAAESIKAAVGIPSGMSGNSSHHPGTNSGYSSVFSGSSHREPGSQQSMPMDLSSNNSAVAASTLQHMQQQANAVAMAKNNQALSQRPKPQRPRIPPPSKIPESAVEMPDDGISNLDVQFGALEFGTDSTLMDFSGLPDSVGSFQDSVSTNMLNNQLGAPPGVQQSVSGGHSNSGNTAAISSSIPISLTSTLSKDSGVAAYGLSSSVPTTHPPKDLTQNSASITGPTQKVSAPETMMMSQQNERKNVSGPTYGNQRTSQSTSVDGPYSSQKSLLSSSNMNSNSSGYSHGSSSMTPLDNLSNVNNQSQNSYMSNAHNASANSYGMQQSAAYNSGSAQTTGYQPQQSAGGYSAASYTYPSQQQQAYNNGGASHSLSNNASKLNSSLNHVDPQQNSSQLSYDNSSGGGLSTSSGGNNQVGSLGGSNLGGSSALGGLVATSSSTITTSVLKNSVPATGKPQPNIPPGVPAATPTMMSHHPYIMSQAAAGLPFYGLQPTIYNIEEMQMMQSRMGYYDMQYQAPTSLTGRDPSMASVAYTDVKFSRADSDASSVATTLSQGQNATQTHGQTFLNAAPALHPGYGYYFPGGMMPGSIPHYAPPMFQQVPPATNAHGASSNTQYQKATAYGSHTYGSGTGTTPDLSNSIYSKSHQPLAKAAGPIGNSSTAYAPTPFIPLLAHGQPHSINLHHHLQDSPQGGAGAHSGPQRSQQSMGQPKGPSSAKQSYPFWNSN